MSKELFDKLFERTVLLFLSGLILLLLGVTGGFTAGSFTIQVTDLLWRILANIFGVFLIGLGVFFVFREGSFNSRKTDNKSGETLLLTEWDVKHFQKRITSANEICLLAVNNNALLYDLSEDFKNFVQRGGQLLCLYIKPDGNAMKMVAQRSLGLAGDMNHLQNQYRTTLKTLGDITKSAIRKDNVQVRLIDYLHSDVVTLIDRQSPNGIAYLTLNVYGKHYLDRPTFIISKEKHPKLFSFLQTTFENTWSSPEAEKLDIPSI